MRYGIENAKKKKWEIIVNAENDTYFFKLIYQSKFSAEHVKNDFFFVILLCVQ